MIGARTLVATWVIAVSAALAYAAPEHDAALEEAAIRLAVSRLGPLREGFGFNERPKFQPLPLAKTEPAAGEDSGWQDGLAPATDLPRMTTGNP
jgi:hypothetical protein